MTLAARVTGRRGLSLPESFGVDAVEAGIRGLAHTAGEPVVVVLVAASGHFFAIISLASAGKKREMMALIIMTGNASSPDPYGLSDYCTGYTYPLNEQEPHARL
ncbi:hypothetical protein [Escherichia coli]|uniref:hypothetical protein n=1 Tax=Escherichia coli TaxID=562 RepID=UPI001EE285B7|nr:hypothetical protein [Escherichia coli]GJH75991.1 hypothetical protein ECZC06_55850 [Escherichia coli]